MQRIAFVVPWIGKLPNYFPLWLSTCKENSTIDFLVFTDDKTEYQYPENVKVYYLEFSEIKKRFQSKYNFPIALDGPYKFCDFKPAYGELFAEELCGYDFWGHCDVDLLWGDIRSFITESILDKYDRIYSRGHCILYRNAPEVNAWYRNLPNMGCQDYRTVFQTPKSCCFDEWAGHCGGGLSYIIQENGIDCYDEPDMADIDLSKGYFKVHRWENQTDGIRFRYKNGKLFTQDKKTEREIIYCHFQKRKIRIDENFDRNDFYLIAPGIVTSNPDARRKRKEEIRFQINYYLKLAKRYFKNK